MHRATGIVVALGAAVAAFAALAGAVDAGNGPGLEPSRGWHSQSRLTTVDERLKRSRVADLAAPSRPPRWRSSAEAGEVGLRRNAWRTAVVRPRTRPVHSQTASTADGYDEALVAALNQVRRRHGLHALRPSTSLEAAAALHSRNMARRGFFAHESADGSAFWKRVETFYSPRGYRQWAVGENLIWGSPELTVDEAVQGWMDSPGHRANILSRDWREIGLASIRVESAPGVYGGRKVTIVTCEFGVRL